MQVNQSDGKIQIQTRNLKYGKLLNGFMLKIDSNFVRRMKNHIIEFFGTQTHPYTIGCIIGADGTRPMGTSGFTRRTRSSK